VSAGHCNVAVFASGHGSNFKAIAEACRRSEYPARVVCLVTDNPSARAVEIARDFDVPVHVIQQPEKKAKLLPEVEEQIVSVCKKHQVDLIALAGFMRILRGAILTEYDGRIMNIHPSLLPSFKGLNAVGQALDAGVKVAGCTVHFVDRSVDGGAIILQAAVPVDDGDSEESLHAKIHREEHRIYAKAIELFSQRRLKIVGNRVRILGPMSSETT
jgi:phosphoribosylglycinamide formyltransferase-1